MTVINKKRGLGRGLEELLSVTLATSLPDSQEAELLSVSIEALLPGPYQPRRKVQPEGLTQLAESIRNQGILQPIVVRTMAEGKYTIIAGERRWRAAQLADLKKVPILVREVSEETAMTIALIENIQREDLNPLEEALAFKRLSETLHLSHAQLAETIGKSRTNVTNVLRLLTLNPDVQALLESGALDKGHARALLGLKGSLQGTVAKTVVDRGLSVRETERLVNKLQEKAGLRPKKETTLPGDPNIQHLEEQLADTLGARVMIRHGRTGQGMVVIRYHTIDELEGILAHIR